MTDGAGPDERECRGDDIRRVPAQGSHRERPGDEGDLVVRVGLGGDAVRPPCAGSRSGGHRLVWGCAVVRERRRCLAVRGVDSGPGVFSRVGLAERTRPEWSAVPVVSSHPTYPNPTLTEVVCELRFPHPAEKPWDP